MEKYRRVRFTMSHKGNRIGTENAYPESQALRLVSQGVAELVDVAPVTLSIDNVDQVVEPFVLKR